MARSLRPARPMARASLRAEVARMAGEKVDALGRAPVVFKEIRHRAERAARQAGPLVDNGEPRLRLRQQVCGKLRRKGQLPAKWMSGGAHRRRSRRAERRRDHRGEPCPDAADADDPDVFPARTERGGFKVGFRIKRIEGVTLRTL